MTTAYTVEYLDTAAGRNVIVVKWAGIPLGSSGTPWCSAEYNDKTVHILGVFNGTTVTIEGSNQLVPTGYVGLVDPQGNSISQAATGIEAILENPLWIRPIKTVGGALTAIIVIIVARRVQYSLG